MKPDLELKFYTTGEVTDYEDNLVGTSEFKDFEELFTHPGKYGSYAGFGTAWCPDFTPITPDRE